jgi:hypothetical protein
MTPDEVEIELQKLFSAIGGGTETLEHVRGDTLECLEEARAEDALRGMSSSEPFVNFLTFARHAGS